MDSFTEFDITKSNYLKQLKSISKNSGENVERVIKCFLVFIFAYEFVDKERGGQAKQLKKLLDSIEYSSSIRQNTKLYNEIICFICDILKEYCNVDEPGDISKESISINYVSYFSKGLNSSCDNRELFDYFFYYPHNNKEDSFIAMLINKISKGSEHEILVQEIPMQTGEVAINSLARISLSERKSMNFYLAMRLYLYRVNVDHSNSPNVFYVRDIYHPYFSEKDTYNHEKPNAFDFVYYEQNKNKFVAMILGNAK